MSKVTVIVPTKNSEKTLSKCLDSIKTQSYKNFEIIVVDNDSTDNTKIVAKKYTKKVYNIGPERSAQRNYGAKVAKGEYILFIDSDMILTKDVLNDLILNSKEGIMLVIPEKSFGEGYWAKVKAFERSFYVGNELIEAARFFYKKDFQKVKGYDLELTACEDWDLHNRMKEKGIKTKRIESYILHNEGRINLFGSSKKKRYYSRWVKVYKERYPELSKKQFSFFSRFTFKKLMKSFIFHPILMCSMIIMKFIEFVNTIIN